MVKEIAALEANNTRTLELLPQKKGPLGVNGYSKLNIRLMGRLRNSRHD